MKAFPNDVTAGNLLVVAGAVWKTIAPTRVDVTDTRGTPYGTPIPGTVVDGEYRTFIAYGFAQSSGPCTVTVNPQGTTGDFSWTQDEFTGVLAAAASNTDTQGEMDTPGIATDELTSSLHSLTIGVMTHGDSTVSLAPSLGYIMMGEQEDNLNSQAHHAAFEILLLGGLQPYGISVDYGAGTRLRQWSVQTQAFTPLPTQFQRGNDPVTFPPSNSLMSWP